MAACDQPFDAVEKPELVNLLQYTHYRPAGLNIPSAATIRKRILDMSDEYVKELKEKIQVCPHSTTSSIRLELTPSHDITGNPDIQATTCKVSLSLDAWSSSNGYAFLAIVMHYVTDDWQLGELSSCNPNS